MHLHPNRDAQRILKGHKLPPSGLSADVADSGERRGGPESRSVKWLTPRDSRKKKDGSPLFTNYEQRKQRPVTWSGQAPEPRLRPTTHGSSRGVADHSRATPRPRSWRHLETCSRRALAVHCFLASCKSSVIAAINMPHPTNFLSILGRPESMNQYAEYWSIYRRP